MPGPEETKPNRETDPEALARALELELIMKRASWQKMQARRGTWRALSFLFLFLVMVGALLAYFYFTSVMPRPSKEKSAVEDAQSNR